MRFATDCLQRWLGGAAVVFLAAILTGCEPATVPPPSSASPPRLEFARTATDFGQAEQGALVRAEFPFRNAGGRDLTIENLRTGCQCRAWLAGPSLVAAGGRGTVRVECGTGDTYGRLRRTVTVYAGDPEHAATLLEVRGEVRLEVAADPPALYLGRVRSGERSWRTIDIHTASGVRVLGARYEGGELSVRVRPAARGMRGYTLLLAVDTHAPPGALTGSVIVRTSSASRPELRVPVRGRVVVAGDGET